jgi:Na+/melibiose symporter-like transporter
MNLYFNILLLVSSIIATGFPIIVYINSNLNKTYRIKKIIELLEYRFKIQELRKKEAEFEGAPFIKKKLDNLLIEIDKDFKNKSEKSDRPNVWLFIVIVSLEIFIVFNKLSLIIISKSYESKIYFLEGVFEYPTVRIIGLLLISICSFLTSFILTNWLKNKFKIKSTIKLSIYLILLFNFILMLLIIFAYVILALTDRFIPFF